MRRQLRRPVTNAAARRSLLVLTEGEKTEPQYLTAWRRKYRTGVNVEIDEWRGLAPKSMVDRAVDLKRSADLGARRGRGTSYDEVWCVFDCDDHPHLPEAKQRAADNGVMVAWSNPCLEVWFTLHYEDQFSYVEREEIQRRFRQLTGCGKNLKPSVLDYLVDAYPRARARAISLEAKHVGDGNPGTSNPSSTIWKLIDSIRLAD